MTAFNDMESYADLRLSATELSGGKAAAIKLQSAWFDHVGLAETRFSSPRLVDTRLEHCDLANADWPAGSYLRLEFLDCRMLGFKTIEGKLRDVLFANCNLSFAQFRMAEMRSVVFENCLLKEADFYGANLQGTRFQACDLRQADFSGCKLKDADVRGSQVEALRVSAKDLAGLIVDVMQAAELARLLGVKIR